MLTLRTGRAVRGTVMGVWNPNTDNYRWILINSEPILDPEIKPGAGSGHFIPGHHRAQQAEETLKKNKEKFEILSDTASRLLATEEPQNWLTNFARK